MKKLLVLMVLMLAIPVNAATIVIGGTVYAKTDQIKYVKVRNIDKEKGLYVLDVQLRDNRVYTTAPMNEYSLKYELDNLKYKLNR